MVSPQGRLVYANAESSQKLGYSQFEFLEMRVPEIAAPNVYRERWCHAYFKHLSRPIV
ncbi:PAS domain-containing protein [Ferribacterium limneticum]|uniref:PAS domain-containing protein n=1 Tax=Ferribacterium limneticum TaxID=76259 RepID=UPI00384BFF77